MVVASVDHASCMAIAELPCVFVVALGRTGSSHLLRVLNAIDGYRLSGETDNAWIYMGWFAHTRTLVSRLRTPRSREAAPGQHFSWPTAVARSESNYSDVLCQARQMMLLLHNPQPRARWPGAGFPHSHRQYAHSPARTPPART